jgi:sortase (surface protein transpeptidase)
MWLAVSVVLFALGACCLALGFTRGPAGDAKPPVAPRQAGKRLSPAVVTGQVDRGAKVRRERPPKPLIDRNAAPPTRIRIADIGVSAPITPIGLNPDRSLQVPPQWSATGWYKRGPEPGEQGPAVISGHVDSKSGPAVFYRLGQLHRGALILVRRADHSLVRFRVSGIERWPKDRFPSRRVYRSTRNAALRLITCGGSFDGATGHYRDNTIVYAARVRRSPRSIR